MEFKTNANRVVNRDGISYRANEEWIIDCPEEIGKAYKFELIEAVKIDTKKVTRKKRWK